MRKSVIAMLLAVLLALTPMSVLAKGTVAASKMPLAEEASGFKVQGETQRWESSEKLKEPEPADMTLDEALNALPDGGLHFVTEGQYVWQVIEDYAKTTNGGVHSSECWVQTTVTAEEGDYISFDFQSWGEGSSYDVLRFYVDNVEMNKWGQGHTAWENFNMQLTAGEHTLKWNFTKDSSDNGAGDYALLDNVYLGEIVNAESIVIESAITLPLYTRLMLEYDVLPHHAFNKAVTVTIEDESIVTPLDNGYLIGLTPGTTTIRVASTQNPAIYGECVVTVEDTGYVPAQFYGIANRLSQWVTFSELDIMVDKQIPIGDLEHTITAATYANGYVYGFLHRKEGGQFWRAPFNDITNVTYTKSPYFGVVLDLAFDYASGIMYGTANNTLGDYVLIAVDTVTGHVDEIAGFTDGEDALQVFGIAFDEKGTAYCYSRTNAALYTLDTATGHCTLVGASGGPSPRVGFSNPLTYDYNNGTLFLSHYSNSDTNGFYQLDLETGAAIPFGRTLEITGLFTIPENEPISPQTTIATGVTLSEYENQYIHANDTITLSAEVTPSYAADKSVLWVTDNASVATVDENGVVTGVSEGSTVITAATSNGAVAMSVTVVVMAEGETAPVSELDEALNVSYGNLHFSTAPCDIPWVAVDGHAISTNQGEDQSASVLTAKVTANKGDYLVFDLGVYGEWNGYWGFCDGLLVLLDGEVILTNEGIAEWATGFMELELPAGEHTINFLYIKDYSGSNPGEDCAKLDNIYVGPSLYGHPDTHIEVASSLEIPCAYFDVLSYTVEPSSEWASVPEPMVGYDNVVMASAEEEIATVHKQIPSEYDVGISGRYKVIGRAVGETSIAIFSEANPNVFEFCHVNVTESDYGTTNIYGMCFIDDNDSAMVGDWITFNKIVSEEVASLGQYPASASAAAYAYGNVYGFEEPSDTQKGRLWVAPIDDLGNPTYYENIAISRRAQAMAFDYSSGKFYASLMQGEVTYLYRIDPATGENTEVALCMDEQQDRAVFMQTLAIDYDGNAYGIDFYSHRLYSIDLDTALCTLIGDTNMGVNLPQGMCYDYNTGELLWARLPSGRLYRVDKETAECTEIGHIGVGMGIQGMFMLPEYEPPIGGYQQGDVDGDGTLTSADALIILRHVLEIQSMTDIQCTYADINGDSNIDVTDALLVLRRAMGIGK